MGATARSLKGVSGRVQVRPKNNDEAISARPDDSERSHNHAQRHAKPLAREMSRPLLDAKARVRTKWNVSRAWLADPAKAACLGMQGSTRHRPVKHSRIGKETNSAINLRCERSSRLCNVRDSSQQRNEQRSGGLD